MKKILLLIFLFTAFVSQINAFKPIFDHPTIDFEGIYQKEKLERLFEIIVHIESRGKITAHNIKEDAVGIAQIRQVMIREVNLLVGYSKYTLKDRYNPLTSFLIFKDYMDAVNPTYDLELGARRWNGGRRGETKKSTDVYYKLITKLNKRI